MSLENIVGKGEIACHQTSKCHLQTLLVWKSLKLLFMERVKGHKRKKRKASENIERK